MTLNVSGKVFVSNGEVGFKGVPRTILLTPFDSDVTDTTGNHVPVLGATGSISAVEKKFGAGSFEGTNGGAVNPSTSSVSIPDSPDWHFAANQFTVELWVRFKTVDDIMSFIGQYTNTGNQRAWWLQWTGPSFSNILRFGYSTNGLTGITTEFTWNPVIDTWYHLAVDRDSSNDIRVYLDGTVVATTNAGSDSIFNSTSELFIGKIRSAGFDDQPHNGFIDDVRITSRFARHRGVAFTPPAAPYVFPG